MKRMRVATAVIVILGAASGRAQADVLDLALHRLLSPPAMGKPLDPENDEIAKAAYRQLTSELGVVMAPRFLSPADTVGYSGFQFTVDGSFTTISNQACAADNSADQCPWSRGMSGRDSHGVPHQLPSVASTLTVMARKGIWLPMPSFELGAGVTKLMQSDLVALQVYGKLALHEGFHRWPLPSLAVRGGASRLLGTSQLDLTTVQIDSTISLTRGIAGTVTIAPYLGAAALLVIARGQVLDTTPSIDAYGGGPNSLDLNNNAVFPAQDTIVRWRFYGGLRLSYSVLVLTMDYALSARGSLMNSGAIADRSTDQHTLSISGGFLF